MSGTLQGQGEAKIKILMKLKNSVISCRQFKYYEDEKGSRADAGIWHVWWR